MKVSSGFCFSLRPGVPLNTEKWVQTDREEERKVFEDVTVGPCAHIPRKENGDVHVSSLFSCLWQQRTDFVPGVGG